MDLHVLVVLLDTSASMQQRTARGVRYADLARSAVDVLLADFARSTTQAVLFTSADTERPQAIDGPPFTKLVDACQGPDPPNATPIEQLIAAGARYVDAQRADLDAEDYGEGFRMGRSRMLACMALLTDAASAQMPLDPQVIQVSSLCSDALRYDTRLLCFLITPLPEGDEATDQAERERRYGTPAPTGAARALATTTVAHLARQSGGGCCFLSTDHILYELKSAVMDRERSACWGKTAHLVAGKLGAGQQVAVDAEAPREPAALSVITAGAGWPLPSELAWQQAAPPGGLRKRSGWPVLAYVARAIPEQVPCAFADVYAVRRPQAAADALLQAADSAGLAWPVYAQVSPGCWLPVGALACKGGGAGSTVTLQLSCFNDDAARPWYATARLGSNVSDGSVAFTRMREQFAAFWAALPALHKAPMRAHLARSQLMPKLLPPPPPALVAADVRRKLDTLQAASRQWLEACSTVAQRLMEERAQPRHSKLVSFELANGAKVSLESVPPRVMERMTPAEVIESATTSAAELLAMELASQRREGRMTGLLDHLAARRRALAHTVPVREMSNIEELKPKARANGGGTTKLRSADFDAAAEDAWSGGRGSGGGGGGEKGGGVLDNLLDDAMALRPAQSSAARSPAPPSAKMSGGAQRGSTDVRLQGDLRPAPSRPHPEAPARSSTPPPARIVAEENVACARERKVAASGGVARGNGVTRVSSSAKTTAGSEPSSAPAAASVALEDEDLWGEVQDAMPDSPVAAAAGAASPAFMTGFDAGNTGVASPTISFDGAPGTADADAESSDDDDGAWSAVQRHAAAHSVDIDDADDAPKGGKGRSKARAKRERPESPPLKPQVAAKKIPPLRMPKPTRRQPAASRKAEATGGASPSGSPRSSKPAAVRKSARAARSSSPARSAETGDGDDGSSSSGSPRGPHGPVHARHVSHPGSDDASAGVSGAAPGDRGGTSGQQLQRGTARMQAAQATERSPLKRKAAKASTAQDSTGEGAEELDRMAALLAGTDSAQASGSHTAAAHGREAPSAGPAAGEQQAREHGEVQAWDSDGDDFFKEEAPSEPSGSSSSEEGEEAIPLEHGRRTAALVAAQHIRADAARAEPKPKRPRRE